MQNTEELREERRQLFEDLYCMRVPKRVPISIRANKEYVIQYANMSLQDLTWYPHKEKIEAAADIFCNDHFADKMPFNMGPTFPSFEAFLDSKNMIVSETGYIQHPEVIIMQDTEYDDLIENPVDFIIDTIMPRKFPAIDTVPGMSALSFAASISRAVQDSAYGAAVHKRLIEKYGYFTPAAKSTTFSPFDFIADYFRGITGIFMDIRRYPEKVIAACEALVDLTVTFGRTDSPTPMSECYMPLHMPPFMKEKDFKKFWWPCFKKAADGISKDGHGLSLFCESDWTRYLDYLQELPRGTRIRFEFGDPQLVKDKIGSDAVISGFYPCSDFVSKTEKECIDEAKRLTDILAPGGGYTFDTDKILSTYDGGAENYFAVLNYVYENARY